jgi:KaiC/GvpD/RAD55 family RecA-like ATPase
VIDELAEKAPKVPTTGKRTEEEAFNPSFEGRPEKPLTGFLKVISPFGCRFMNHFTAHPKEQTQPAWWVAVGQTTCFENGRDAAHLISQGYEGYNEKETDELYDRLLQHPPHGCAYIHANFPEHACKSCPMTAPYHIAKKPILALCGDAKHPLAKPDWRRVLTRIRARNSGEEQPGIEWRTAGLDQYTRLRRAEFVVIGARPSVGKTAFMVDAAVNIASDKVPVFLFSGETGETGLTDRLMARVSGIDSKRLRGEGLRKLTEAELRRLDEAAELLAELPIYVNYATTRADQILDLIERTILSERISLTQPYVVFQDYLQFGNPTDGGASDEYARLSKVSQEFKYVASILNNNFISFAQLRRDYEGNDKPELDAVKGTGRIEEVADGLFVLAGERVQGPVAPRFLHCLKQREGEVGWSIKLLLHQAISYFELPTDEAVEKKDLFASDDSIDAAPDSTRV